MMIHGVALGTGRGKGGWLAIKQGEVGCLYTLTTTPASISCPPRGTGAEPSFGLRPDYPIQHAGHPACACPRHPGAMPHFVSSPAIFLLRPTSPSFVRSDALTAFPLQHLRPFHR